jgi:undecaprenyl-diphosphatase
MTTIHAILLGLVEGVTEYLPVSSTGHLILAQRAMGIAPSEAANAYAICIQAGAIAAVAILYYQRLARMAAGVLQRDETGRRMALNLVAAFAPAAIVGFLLDEPIEAYLFGLEPVVAAWFAGGAAIVGIAWWRRHVDRESGEELEQLGWRSAVAIGFVQCLALWPGTSRSLVTIAGGLFVGLRLRAAVEFSFLLGMVTLGAATAYKAWDSGPALMESYGWADLSVGFAVAALSAAAAVKWMVAYLTRHGLAIFGYYRMALAVIVAALLAAGLLD